MRFFTEDEDDGVWTWLAVTPALLQQAAESFDRLPKGAFLRAADAVHLSCARENGLEEVYSNDRHLLASARYFDLEALSVETAGQSAEGSLVNLVGVVDTRKFRDAVLRQKELLAEARAEEAGGRPAGAAAAAGGAATQSASSEKLLVDIRDTLRRIESRLPNEK